MTRPRSATYLTAAALMLVALTAAGCGEDEPAAVCSSVEELQASVEAVTTVDLGQGALTQLESNLSQVRDDLGQVRDDAADEYAGEIDALDEAAASVGTSVEAAVSAPSAQAVTDVGTAIQALGTSMSALQDAVTSTC